MFSKWFDYNERIGKGLFVFFYEKCIGNDFTIRMLWKLFLQQKYIGKDILQWNYIENDFYYKNSSEKILL